MKKRKHKIYLKQKCSELKSKEKNGKVNNDEYPGNLKHTCEAGTCLIVADSILNS